MPNSFVLSDESINDRGYRILTSGINLERFKKNPVMLWMHRRDNGWDLTQVLPIGIWENIRIEEGKLLADPKFDENEKFAQLIKMKVENNLIRGCSIGINPIEFSDDPKNLEKGQTRSTVTKCELYEASIVDIPSNKNTVRLFSATDETEVPILINNEMAEKKETQLTFKSEADLKAYMKEKFGFEPKAEVEKPETEEFKFKSENSLIAWFKEKFNIQPKAPQTEDLDTEEVEETQEADEVEETNSVSEESDPKDQEIARLKAENETLKKAPGATNKKVVKETDSKSGPQDQFKTYASAKEIFDTVNNMFE